MYLNRQGNLSSIPLLQPAKIKLMSSNPKKEFPVCGHSTIKLLPISKINAFPINITQKILTK